MTVPMVTMAVSMSMVIIMTVVMMTAIVGM